MFREYLTSKLKEVLPTLNITGVYAISFFLNYHFGYDVVPYFAISCNTEDNCEHCGQLNEKRWNYAFWLMNEVEIIGSETPDSLDRLQNWYKAINIQIPEDDYYTDEVEYDENGVYIGKGPKGIYEFAYLLVVIVKELHASGYVQEVFGKKIPIIIHDLEYVWYLVQATVEANPPDIIHCFRKYAHQWLGCTK